MDKKSSTEFSRLYTKYDKFVIDNVVKRKNHKESPHIIISKSYCTIADNSILFKNPSLNTKGNIIIIFFFDIEQIMSNIKTYMKSKKY